MRDWIAVLLLTCASLPAFGAAGELRPGLDLGALIGGEAAAGFAVADGPRPFRFPEDHGPHPDYRTEWWYLVAHVEDERGRPFGIQFTLFRQALAPPGADADEGASRWRTRQVWMAHVALSGPDGEHQASERFARGELGLAGVTAAPFAAWLEDWRLAASEEEEMFPLELEARVEDVARPYRVELSFDQPRGPILQGDRGFSRKSESEGNASYYYSFTRMQAHGHILLDGERYQVTGLGWLDREWSTSVLDAGQTGWDWFALHLDDGRDLKVFQIRRDDGSIDAASAGMLVATDGSTTPLARGDFELQPLRSWEDGDGGSWPVAWRLRIPKAGIDGRVVARHDDQLNRLAVRYWEGQVCLDGPVPGCGFLEMTGYGSE